MKKEQVALLTDFGMGVHFSKGQILFCEKDTANRLGFELLKRMSRVVIRRLQAARDKMLAVHAHEADLEPVMVDPDLATPGPEIYNCDDNDLTFHEGAD